MLYICYKFKQPDKGWKVKNFKLGITEYCGPSLITAIRIYLWHAGVPANKAINFLRKKKIIWV